MPPARRPRRRRQLGAAQQPDFVDEARGDKGRRYPGAALHHQPGDALVGERMQHGHEIEPRRRRRVVATRITCAPAAPSFMAAAASDRLGCHHPQRRLARGMNQPAGAGYPQAPVQHHPHRRTRFHARQPAGQKRIVRQHGADPDQDGVALRAQQMHARLGGFARIATGLRPAAPILSSLDTASLRITCGTLVADPPEVSGMVARSLERAEPDIDRDAGGAKSGMALPDHFGIGILDRRHHAGNASGNDGVGARRRLADMRAWLQRHIKRGAARGLAGALERLRLGMGTAARLRPAAPDDDAVLDHDRADGGIGPGAALPAPPERQRKLHEALVGGFRRPRIFARTGLPECGRSFS